MEFHRALARRTDIDWSRINAFGVDEFWRPGMPAACCVCEEPRRVLAEPVNPRQLPATVIKGKPASQRYLDPDSFSLCGDLAI